MIDATLAIGYSTLASVAERRSVRVHKVDGAWLHEWRDGAYLCARPVRRPVNEVQHLFPYFFYAYVPRVGDVVVDVGAGVGTEVVEFARLVGRRGRVIAIEAHPPSAELCARVVTHLGLTNVRVVTAAVAAAAGPVRISDRDDAIANRLADEGIDVRGATLPELLAEVAVDHVDYMKVNIEGAERLLFEGMAGSTLRIERICVSCHDFVGGPWFETFAMTRQWLIDNGYDVTRHPPVEGAPYAEYYLYGTLRRSETADSSSE